MLLNNSNYLEVMHTLKERSGLTNVEIAKRMGVSSQHVSRLLSGVWGPRIETFTKFINACKGEVEVE